MQAGAYIVTQAQILAIGEYHYATQQYDLAEAVFARVPEAGSAAQRLYELGQRYEQAGDMERAVQAYREAGNDTAAVGKATAIQQDPDYHAAEKLYQARRLEDALPLHQQTPGYMDTDEKTAAIQLELTCRAAEAQYKAMEWESAQALYVQIHGYKDADSKARFCINSIELLETYL